MADKKKHHPQNKVTQTPKPAPQPQPANPLNQLNALMGREYLIDNITIHLASDETAEEIYQMVMDTLAKVEIEIKKHLAEHRKTNVLPKKQVHIETETGGFTVSPDGTVTYDKGHKQATHVRTQGIHKPGMKPTKEIAQEEEEPKGDPYALIPPSDNNSEVEVIIHSIEYNPLQKKFTEFAQFSTSIKTKFGEVYSVAPMDVYVIWAWLPVVDGNASNYGRRPIKAFYVTPEITKKKTYDDTFREENPFQYYLVKYATEWNPVSAGATKLTQAATGQKITSMNGASEQAGAWDRTFLAVDGAVDIVTLGLTTKKVVKEGWKKAIPYLAATVGKDIVNEIIDVKADEENKEAYKSIINIIAAGILLGDSMKVSVKDRLKEIDLHKIEIADAFAAAIDITNNGANIHFINAEKSAENQEAAENLSEVTIQALEQVNIHIDEKQGK